MSITEFKEKLNRLEDLRRRFLDLQEILLSAKGAYHYSARKVNNFGDIERRILKIMPHTYAADGLDVPVTCGLAPVILSDRAYRELKLIGNMLNKVVEFQWSMIEKNARIRNELKFDTEYILEREIKDPLLPLWMRIDYLIDKGNGKLFIVDINMLPGGIYFTHVLNGTYQEYIKSIFPEFEFLRTYCIDSLFAMVSKRLGLSAPPLGSYSVSAKNDHGLFTEHVGLSEGLSHLSGAPVRFMPPKLLDTSSGIVIRGFRLKHLNGTELENVRYCALNGTQFLPPFKLVTDNHLWFYFFRKYRNELDKFLSPTETDWFLSRIPPTYKVGFNGKRFVAQPDDECSEEFEVTDATIRGFVLKGCTSTGGRKVTIVERAGGRNTRARALEELKESQKNKNIYLLQKYIVPSKSTNYGFTPQGDIGWITLPTKYSAFYCGGEFIGGIAVLQGSHKIQGSLLSTNAPVFWRSNGT